MQTRGFGPVISIGQVADKTGLSIRTLRHWEDKGLVKPTRSEAGQRYYGADALMRLGHIKSLKDAGFGLSEISALLSADQLDATTVVQTQLSALKAEKQRIDGAVARLDETLRRVKAGQDMAPEALCALIKLGDWAVSRDACREAWQKVYDRFYTPQEQQAWREAREAIEPEAITEIENRWPVLIARIERLVRDHARPDSDEAGACVAEWRALVAPIIEFDPSLADSTARLYDQMDDWPESAAEPPFSKTVWQFIQAAAEAHPDKAA